MTERIAYNEYAKLKDNTIITMKIGSGMLQLMGVSSEWEFF